MIEKTANAIYDLLVKCGGAHEDMRDNFVFSHIADEYPTHEYRFQGHFGFGGKFYTSDSVIECPPWRVGYHPEDVKSNPELYQSLCVAINKLLENLYEQTKEQVDE